MYVDSFSGHHRPVTVVFILHQINLILMETVEIIFFFFTNLHMQHRHIKETSFFFWTQRF